MMGRTCKFVPVEQKVSVIHVTGYEDKNMEGTFNNAYFTEAQAFTNLTQLLFLIENLQDNLQYPQKGMEIRSFKSDTESPYQPPPSRPPAGETKATFKLHLLFRQNASWQGSVTWVETGMEAQFRSALELITLMDSVLA